MALPPGYRIELVAEKLDFPTSVVFDDSNGIYVVEAGYSYGEVFATPRLVQIVDGKSGREVAVGKNPPWTGGTFHRGMFFVAEGGTIDGGRLLEIAPNGTTRAIVEGLPSLGDHHTNGPVVGPDGALYFGQGTATNAGVVGEDNADFGWLSRHPEVHDVPCKEVTLTGVNFATRNPLSGDPEARVETGAFVPFGTSTSKGHVVPGSLKCNGAVYRVRLDDGAPARLELVAWGFRNPFGVAFDGGGQLFVTDNQFDVRGSRPVFGTGDVLWRVEEGGWYGWPDFAGGRAVAAGRFKPPDGPLPPTLLQGRPPDPPEATAFFAVHSSSNGLDFARSDAFGHVGEAFVAQFGDMAPGAGKVLAPVGFKVVRVDVKTGVVADFATNRGDENGPASMLKSGGLERPIAVRFSPDGSALYVVDFGVMRVGPEGPKPELATGRLWKITRAEAK